MEKNAIVNSQTNIFQNAVSATPDVSSGYCKGLQAMKGNSSVLKVADSRRLQGSVDIDECTKRLYPQEARWDYVIGYGDRAYFVEVHPANTSNVTEMVNKANWLEKWLRNKAPELEKLRVDILYWVPSGKVAILRNSPQYRKLALHKLVLTKTPFEIK